MVMQLVKHISVTEYDKIIKYKNLEIQRIDITKIESSQNSKRVGVAN